MTEYLQLMKLHSDNLGQAGSLVPTRILISQVLLGLYEEYNAVVATLQGKPELSLLQMQSELLPYEKRLEAQNAHKTVPLYNTRTVNMVSNRGPSNHSSRKVKVEGNNFSTGNRGNNGGQSKVRGRGR